MTGNRTQKIVIVGGGFGGVHAYEAFHKKLHGTHEAEITLINPSDRFTFTPLIHEVATGNLQPDGVTQSLRTLPQCCLDRFIDGEAVEVDCDRKVVRVRQSGTPGDPKVPGDDVIEVQYDYLVLAMGSKTNFFDVPGAEELSLQLKSLADAKKIKNRVVEAFEHAQTLRDPQQQARELTFIIAGGGPTGVELAGEMADFIAGEIAKSFPAVANQARIVLIDRGDQLLKRVSMWFSKKATEILKYKKGVYLMQGTSVEAVTEEGVETDKGFVYGTVIWTTGVVARSIAFSGHHGAVCDEHSCRVQVNSYLQIPEHTDIFVVGDQAAVPDKESEHPYPMRAQFAVRQGRHSANNIVHMVRGEELEEFSFRERGMIVSLGTGGALAKLSGMHFSGPIAWFIYRTVYLFSLIGWRARLRTALEWTLNLFLPRDISKL